jgi:uncharacterized membrane protein YoaK (UPF0700 family)
MATGEIDHAPRGPAAEFDGAAADAAGPGVSRRLLGVLMLLTVSTGLIDAVSYLGLGHVFVANMTGNVVFLGFAFAGAQGFSIAASMVALGAFLVGAALAGRVSVALGRRWRQWLPVAAGAQMVLAGMAAILSGTGALGAVGNGRFGLIAVLAAGTGIQNATVRKLAVPDITTTVLTLTLTGVAADSSLAGGTNPRALRRVTAVVTMFAGALIGAVLVLHAGLTATLWVLTGLYAVITGGLLACRSSDPELAGRVAPVASTTTP